LRHVGFGLGIGGVGTAQAACPAKTNLHNISNLRNINSPDVVTAERRSHHARIVRPESE
jgi:hypothetical protein